MKWKRGAKSRDVIDVRGASGGSSGGGGGLPIPGGLGGIGGGAGLIVVIVIVAINVLGGGSGGTGFDLPGLGGATAPGANDPQPLPPGEDPQAELKDFSAYVFDDAQDVWESTFDRSGDAYDTAKLVLYSGAVRTDGCGGATSAVGPFYCPADERVYLDLSFYGEMRRQLGASGDFAWAYVIAHEMGHHVQRMTGTSDAVERLSRSEPADANELSVRQELQADCYAGVWAATVYAEGALEPGDLDEAFNAAEAVGDDRLQRQATGSVDPDSFTHGTSEQRRTWFERGYRSGDPGDCDTFAAETL
ncbi:MAG TPA: neutral zinc metallopeptidase [Solirubrobacterales bacterium]|nr:neutral zinc metallopeptidase [Solirubrobacterales bacterium]